MIEVMNAVFEVIEAVIMIWIFDHIIPITIIMLLMCWVVGYFKSRKK